MREPASGARSGLDNGKLTQRHIGNRPSIFALYEFCYRQIGTFVARRIWFDAVTADVAFNSRPGRQYYVWFIVQSVLIFKFIHFKFINFLLFLFFVWLSRICAFFCLFIFHFHYVRHVNRCSISMNALVSMLNVCI